MAHRDDLDNDMSFLVALRRWTKIMDKTHGYGGVFNRNTQDDKTIVELGTVQEWQESVAAEFDFIVSAPRINYNDPPDCYVEFEGQNIGVELVQLIDQNHKLRADKGESPYAGQLYTDMQWSKERFESKVEELIRKKGEKYKKRNICIDVLLIHAAEPWLHSPQVNEWLKAGEIREHESISSVFLLLDYEPGRGTERWPVFWLYGHPTVGTKRG